MKQPNAVSLLRQCELEVHRGAPHEELLYTDSGAGSRQTPLTSSAREAWQAKFAKVIREVVTDWAPLGSPQDAAGFPSALEAEGEARSIELALFPKGPLLGYLVLRETTAGRIRFYVGVLRKHDDEPTGGGSGEGRDAHAALPIGKWVM